MELLKYQGACIDNLKEKYYTELYDKITDFNDQNSTSLSSMDIWEDILRFMI